MSIRGKRGRPHGAQDAKREKLLETARTFLRSKTKHEVSRLKIARYAGVAPSLMTYYFNTKSDLVLAVTRPVMTEAIEKLIATLSLAEPPEERLTRTAMLFIEFARINGSLLDLFVEAVTTSGDESGQYLIHSCIDSLELFFAEAVQAGLVSKDVDPTLLLLAMWGMCRLVGETPPLPLRNVRPDAGLEERTATEAAFIAQLILRGANSVSDSHSS